MSRSGFLIGVIAVLCAWTPSPIGADEQPAEKSAIVVGKPTVSGKGPYRAEFRGTVRLERTAKEFTGARMLVRDANQKGAEEIGALVSFPDPSPKPGQSGTVVFTATLPKGTYTGVAEMEFIGADGKRTWVKFDVPRFEVP